MPQVPKFDPQRGSRGRGPVKLPAEGPDGAPPAWPLDDQLPGEAAAWAQLWSTPQAVVWGRLGWTRTVARYCRLMVAAEQPDATAAMHAQATALEDRLGLTPKAMRLLLWEIVSDDVAEARTTGGKSARDRMRAV